MATKTRRPKEHPKPATQLPEQKWSRRMLLWRNLRASLDKMTNKELEEKLEHHLSKMEAAQIKLEEYRARYSDKKIKPKGFEETLREFGQVISVHERIARLVDSV